MNHHYLFYCRAGFEPELAQELQTRAGELGHAAYAKTERASGYVTLVSEAPIDFDARDLIFARQGLRLVANLNTLDTRDRLGPILSSLRAEDRFVDAWVELPDAEGGGEALAALARALESALVATLRKKSLLHRESGQRLHLLLLSGTHILVAIGDVATSAPWRGGIPRLKFPRDAPSRSTLKLEEAFLVMLDDREREAWLKPGMTAVDLGASPGGWTYQLVRRSIRVIAVDNGPMDEALMQSGIVEHRREDGFRFRPKKPVDWLVCDMVEQPIRVAELVSAWLEAGACRQAMFNLKLPMKKRFAELERCLDLMHSAFGERLDLRAKQLYHDREEVTVFARLR